MKLKFKTITTDDYYSIMCGVPTLYQDAQMFICSEPYDINEDGEFTYGICFFDSSNECHEFYYKYDGTDESLDRIKQKIRDFNDSIA